MVEVETSAPRGQGKDIPEVIKEELGQSLAQPKSVLAPMSQPEIRMPSTQVLNSEVVLPSPPPSQGRASIGWTEEMEETLKGSSLKEEHRALIGAALQGSRSAGAGLHEVFKNLVTSFDVCLFVPNWLIF